MRTLRRFWPLVALALLVVVGALLHASRRVPPDRGRPPASATVRVVAAPADVTRGRNPENVGRPSPGAAALAFALPYLRYLDGRASADALSEG